MVNENIHQQPEENKLPKKPSKDIKDIVREHLSDPNHEITDEEIRGVEIGKTDEVSPVGAEVEARFRDQIVKDEEGGTMDRDNDDEDKGLGNQTPPNPWVVLK